MADTVIYTSKPVYRGSVLHVDSVISNSLQTCCASL